MVSDHANVPGLLHAFGMSNCLNGLNVVAAGAKSFCACVSEHLNKKIFETEYVRSL